MSVELRNTSVVPSMGLPSFVTSEALRELLGWANSHQRQFRSKARKYPFSGWSPPADNSQTYEAVTQLLALQGGIAHFEKLAATANVRQLAKTLARRGHEALQRIEPLTRRQGTFSKP